MTTTGACSTRYAAGIAGLVAVLGSTGCATTGPTTEAWKPPPPGSTYVVARRNTGSWGSGSSQIRTSVGERSWNGTNVVTFTSPQGATVYSKDNRLIAFLDPAGKTIMTWEPPDSGHGLRFPLSVGKTWTERGQIRMADGKLLPHENECRVEAREAVSVPAGSFDAFRIRCTSPRGLETTQWYAPEPGLTVKSVQVRSASNPFGGAGTRDDELVSLERR
jgi:hypothetical protein